MNRVLPAGISLLLSIESTPTVDSLDDRVPREDFLKRGWKTKLVYVWNHDAYGVQGVRLVWCDCGEASLTVT